MCRELCVFSSRPGHQLSLCEECDLGPQWCPESPRAELTQECHITKLFHQEKASNIWHVEMRCECVWHSFCAQLLSHAPTTVLLKKATVIHLPFQFMMKAII